MESLYVSDLGRNMLPFAFYFFLFIFVDILLYPFISSLFLTTYFVYRKMQGTCKRSQEEGEEVKYLSGLIFVSATPKTSGSIRRR